MVQAIERAKQLILDVFTHAHAIQAQKSNEPAHRECRRENKARRIADDL